MLSRYTIYRRRPQDAEPLPIGIRQDTRWRTRHILHPTQEMVETYLADPSESAWKKFRSAYLAELRARYKADPAPFQELAEFASEKSVFLGCSCPTKKNPNVRHCHTWPALEFMEDKFPGAGGRFPSRRRLGDPCGPFCFEFSVVRL